MNRNPRNPNTPNHQSPSSDESGPLPFGNFDESAGAIAPESNDRDLVAFLKQHRPIAPPEPANFETDLMAAIAQEPLPAPLPATDMPPTRKPKRWRMVVGAIAAGLVGAVLGHNLGAWTNPGMRFADAGSETTITEAELELFLENGWDGAIAQTDSTDNTFVWETSDEM